MEEYKYHLLENHDGDDELLRRFLDSLSELERRRLFSLELKQGTLTLSWQGRIPTRWQDRTEIQLPDSTIVRLDNLSLDRLQLAPSLVQSLRYLCNLKDNTIPYEGAPPSNIDEAIFILEAYGLLTVNDGLKFEKPTSLAGQIDQLKFSVRLTDYIVAPEAHDLLN